MFDFKDVYSIYFILWGYDSFYIMHRSYSTKSNDCWHLSSDKDIGIIVTIHSK